MTPAPGRRLTSVERAGIRYLAQSPQSARSSRRRRVTTPGMCSPAVRLLANGAAGGPRLP